MPPRATGGAIFGKLADLQCFGTGFRSSLLGMSAIGARVGALTNAVEQGLDYLTTAAPKWRFNWRSLVDSAGRGAYR